MTSILVTGGAGYIGSHTCKALRRAGFDPIKGGRRTWKRMKTLGQAKSEHF